MSESSKDREKLGFFNETKRFETIEENETHTGYVFKKLDRPIVKYLKSVVLDLENDENVYFCARGDSKDANQDFIDNKLIDFFVVGEKSKAHIDDAKNDISKEPFRHYETNNPTIDDLKYIITDVNKVLKAKQKPTVDGINGQIPIQFLTEVEKQPESIQKGWKFIFLAFLHNNGDEDYFKPYSGFVSLTHTGGKYKKAKFFALKWSSNGLIYIYILNKNLKNYFKADDLKKRLSRFGVNWYKDKHKEIMVINGLYPHYILGFFEVEGDLIKRFILNPWFYSQFKADLNLNQKYDYSNGVLIDQENFEESLANLGYKTYFIRDLLTNKEYHVDPESAEIKDVIEPI
ncbi:hypothetical protein [Methanomethylovorans sp.]|uniref:hypothetical protein n=1 Tax=Methanomethylovorans sp. TaxID=2758717 RepID=UPI00345E9458